MGDPDHILEVRRAETHCRKPVGEPAYCRAVVGILLSITFACGLVIAIAHVANRRFVAPVYDVVANLTAFACATAASSLLGHWAAAVLSSGAIGCWLVLARRTILARKR